MEVKVVFKFPRWQKVESDTVRLLLRMGLCFARCAPRFYSWPPAVSHLHERPTGCSHIVQCEHVRMLLM